MEQVQFLKLRSGQPGRSSFLFCRVGEARVPRQSCVPPHLGGELLLICQAKQMWRGDNIYFHNSKQIWRAAFLSAGPAHAESPAPTAVSRSIYSSPIELSFLWGELVSAGTGDRLPGAGVGAAGLSNIGERGGAATAAKQWASPAISGSFHLPAWVLAKGRGAAGGQP